MLKRVIVLFLISIYIGTYFGVFALNTSQKGAILDTFKEKQYDLLFESNLGNLDDNETEIFNLAKKVNLFDNISKNVEDDMKGFKDKSLENLTKIASLEDQIASLDEDIESTNVNITKLNNKIIEVKNEIFSTKNVVEVIGKKIEDNNEVLLKYLVYLYKKQNSVYSNNDIDNLKSILLNGENISDIIDDLYFKGIIETTGTKLIDKHKLYISELYIKKVDLEKQEESLKKIRNNLIVNRKVLDDKKEFKNSLLKVSKGKQSLYEKYINEKIEVEKGLKLKAFKERLKFDSAKENLLKKYNCEFVDIAKNPTLLDSLTENCIDLNKIIYAESKLKGFGEIGINIFSWPIDPVNGISAYFRDKGYKQVFASDHDAIDVITQQGTPIRAPADGYVMYVEEPTTPDYSFLALKHADSFVTVYGHLSEILVKNYDYVKKGQIIAKSGGEYGTNGAGYVTTGPHLHFELYKEKEAVDPLNYLSLADFPYKYLIDKYRFKFYNDFKEKKGFDYEEVGEDTRVFKLDGDSEIERQKDLIKKYAIGDFNNWQMWVDESLIGNLDPTFVMCVGLAETGLGKHLKTPYNVGNIGNTDSGAVKTFENARSGVYAMVYTFNNKYLGKYNEIKDLSRYGNKDGQIYASSPDHWHNNVITCMSHIKGRFVPDEYNFRIIR